MSTKSIVFVSLLLAKGLFCIVNVHSNGTASIEYIDTFTNDSCIMMSADDLIQYGREHKYPNGIPKIMHYMDKTKHIPPQYSPIARQCMMINKDVRFVFWSHKLAEIFIQKHFPAYAAKHQSYTDVKSQILLVSDVNRYFILYYFGGIYMDFDTRCQKPFVVAMKNRPCILSTQLGVESKINVDFYPIVMNSMMTCVPKHEFFRDLINKLIPATKTPMNQHTGSVFLTFAYLAYNRTSFNAKEPTKLVVLAEEQEFSPITAADLEHSCTRMLTQKLQIEGCKELADHRKRERQKEKQAVVAHLYLHLGYNENADAIKVRDNICTILDKVYFVS